MPSRKRVSQYLSRNEREGFARYRYHGWHTLFLDKGLLWQLGSRVTFHMKHCRDCIHYPDCTKTKQIPPDHDYCVYPGRKFESVKLIQNAKAEACK